MDRALAARPALRRLLVVVAVLTTLACLAAAVALWMGAGVRVPGVGPRGDAGARYVVLYVAPLMLAAPLWARARLDQLERLSPAASILDVLVTSLAFARFVVGTVLPFSGHMLFLTYTVLTLGRVRWYRWLAVVLLVETTIFKLWLWRDPYSWSIGLGLGAVAAAVALRTSRVASA